MPVKSNQCLAYHPHTITTLMKTINHQRRRLLVGGGLFGTLALSGCETLLAGGRNRWDSLLNDLNNYADGTDRARAIFQQLQSGQPITPGNPQGELKVLKKLNTEFLEGQQKFQSAMSSGKPVSFETLVDALGKPLSDSMRFGFYDAAKKDKAAYMRSLAKKGAPQKLTIKGSTLSIPPGKWVQFDQRGYCMDPSLPAPNQGDAFFLEQISERIPEPLAPLYRALGNYRGANDSTKQRLTWALMGAGTKSPYMTSIDHESLLHFEKALPGGAKILTDYHNQQVMLNALLRMALKTSGLDQYVSADDLTNPNSRDAAVDRHLDQLIASGQSMGSVGKGTGYQMLAPDVAASVTGAGPLTLRVTIINASQDVFEFNSVDWFAKPVARKQSVSTNDIFQNVKEGSAPVVQPDDNAAVLNDVDLKTVSDKTLSEMGGDGLAKAILKEVSKYGLGKAFGEAPVAKSMAQRATDFVAQKVGLPPGARKVALSVLGDALTAVPVVGNILSGYEAISGRDWLTGETLSLQERALAAVGTVPGANLVSSIAKASKVPVGTKFFDFINKQSSVFSFIDRTEGARTVASLAVSDIPAEALKAGGMVDAAAGLTRFQDVSKEISKTIYQTQGTLPWTESVNKALESMSKSVSSTPSFKSMIGNIF